VHFFLPAAPLDLRWHNVTNQVLLLYFCGQDADYVQFFLPAAPLDLRWHNVTTQVLLLYFCGQDAEK